MEETAWKRDQESWELNDEKDQTHEVCVCKSSAQSLEHDLLSDKTLHSLSPL